MLLAFSAPTEGWFLIMGAKSEPHSRRRVDRGVRFSLGAGREPSPACSGHSGSHPHPQPGV